MRKIRTIEYNDFKANNYNTNKISNFKLINGKCIRCNKLFEYSCVKKFMRSRQFHENQKNLWDTCSSCWHKIQTSENTNWIEKNRKAQLIAQNKPEQKIKNAKGVSKSWTKERREEASKHLLNKWKNDLEFSQKVLKNLSWTQHNNTKFYENLRKSIGIGGLKGSYNNIHYDSALELSYILWCEEQSLHIERYFLDPIKYIDENNKQRLYIPDFIVQKTNIIEIKGFGLFYKKNYKRNILKYEALKDFAKTNNFDYKLILGDSEILKKNYKKARKIHHENKK